MQNLDRRDRILKFLESKIQEARDVGTEPMFCVFQATLGIANLGLYLTEGDAETSILNYNPEAKRTKLFRSNLRPPTGEYSIVSMAVSTEPNFSYGGYSQRNKKENKISPNLNSD
jgi:hypothetical protein